LNTIAALGVHIHVSTSKRIIYWNVSCLEPEIEAISKEVFLLAHQFRNSFIFSVTPHHVFKLSFQKRFVGFHSKYDPLLRIVIPIVEKYCDINHIYGDVCPWIFYKTLKHKPIVLTIASERGNLNVDFIERCKKVIVQTETLKKRLLEFGVNKDKVEVLYPGLDLSRFNPKMNSHNLGVHPKILFATAPRSQKELTGRGVPLLLMAAKESPDVQYHLLYRKWNRGYTSFNPTEQLIANYNLKNVTLTNSIVHDMSGIYRDHHFTIIPYTNSSGGKECPNSLIESLACGRPVLISSISPFAYFIEKYQCGVVFDPTPASLIAAIEKGMKNYWDFSGRAAMIANKYFSQEKLFQRMSEIYEKLPY
jgi:glycosyltransferase involved in cell wall biosynthesis